MAGQLDDVLLRVNAEVVIGERSDNFGKRNAGHGDAKGAQVAVLEVGVGLGIDAGEERGRLAALKRALGFVDARAGDKYR